MCCYSLYLLLIRDKEELGGAGMRQATGQYAYLFEATEKDKFKFDQTEWG